MFRRRTVRSKRPKLDPETSKRLLAAMGLLKGEFLKDAMDYAASLAVGAGDLPRAQEILESLGQMISEIQRPGESEQPGSARPAPDWVQSLVDEVEGLRERGVVSRREIPGERTGPWVERLERLVFLARAVEEFGTEPMGEIRGEEYSEAAALIGALEDSYVLSLSADPTRRARRLTTEEVMRRIKAVRAEGAWDPNVALKPHEA